MREMAAGQKLGRPFGWLWAAFAVSAYGTGFGFGAFPLIAIRVLHSGPAQVSALSAAGLAAGAAVAVPLGPWVEFRRKRPVMIAMDLIRFAALISIPAAYAVGALSFAQLLAVSVIVAAAKITFNAASGAFVKSLVPPGQLLRANGRFESTLWTSIVVGPPLGGAAVGFFGLVTTVLADAVSYLLSAAGIRAIGGSEPRPARPSAPPDRAGRISDLLDGWRTILAHPGLRRAFCNRLLVGGLILATEPLLAVLMLGQLHFAPWQYGLAFAAPCTGGLIGSRLARRLVARFGRHRVMWVAGSLGACWPVWLVFVRPGVPGIALVIVVQFGLVLCLGIFNPVLATYRLDQIAGDRVARALSAWSVSTTAATAALTALWGLLATLTSPRAGIGAAGLLLLGTPFLLPRRDLTPGREQVPAPLAA
jgi:MFS family permease